MRLYLDYVNIIYDPPNNERLNQKLREFNSNYALVITGAAKGTSQSNLYKELGFECLKCRCCFRKLYIFYEIKTGGVIECLIPETYHIFNNCSLETVATF